MLFSLFALCISMVTLQNTHVHWSHLSHIKLVNLLIRVNWWSTIRGGELVSWGESFSEWIVLRQTDNEAKQLQFVYVHNILYNLVNLHAEQKCGQEPQETARFTRQKYRVEVLHCNLITLIQKKVMSNNVIIIDLIPQGSTPVARVF